jgi:hypothetical protein
MRISLAPWILIRIEIKAGSGSVLEPMRIHNSPQHSIFQLFLPPWIRI